MPPALKLDHLQICAINLETTQTRLFDICLALLIVAIRLYLIDGLTNDQHGAYTRATLRASGPVPPTCLNGTATWTNITTAMRKP